MGRNLSNPLLYSKLRSLLRAVVPFGKIFCGLILFLTSFASAQETIVCPPGMSCGPFIACGSSYCNPCTQRCNPVAQVCEGTGLFQCADGRCLTKESECACSPSCSICSQKCNNGVCEAVNSKLCFNATCVDKNHLLRCNEDCGHECKPCIEQCEWVGPGENQVACKPSGKSLVNGECFRPPADPDHCNGTCDPCLERCGLNTEGNYGCLRLKFRRCPDGACIPQASLCSHERTVTCPTHHRVGEICCRLDTFLLVWLLPEFCTLQGGSALNGDQCSCEDTVCCLKNGVYEVKTSGQCLLDDGERISNENACDPGCCNGPFGSVMTSRHDCETVRGGTFLVPGDVAYNLCVVASQLNE